MADIRTQRAVPPVGIQRDARGARKAAPEDREPEGNRRSDSEGDSLRAPVGRISDVGSDARTGEVGCAGECIVDRKEERKSFVVQRASDACAAKMIVEGAQAIVVAGP